jgi:alkanesulfonate monooxygenase SsuD/methylene tetrahydromethanopterin reductase-like flavin-dependent oxidoreductase (luciferase family)
MKIRIGVGFSGWPFERTKDFWDFVDLVEASGLDSVWLNDRIRNPTPALEPITGLAMIAGRTERLKFGMSVAVLPVRDPIVSPRRSPPLISSATAGCFRLRIGAE